MTENQLFLKSTQPNSTRLRQWLAATMIPDDLRLKAERAVLCMETCELNADNPAALALLRKTQAADLTAFGLAYAQ